MFSQIKNSSYNLRFILQPEPFPFNLIQLINSINQLTSKLIN